MKKNDQTNYVRYGELSRIKGVTTVIKADVAGKQDKLTTAQMAAVDSGITAEILSKLLDGLFTVTEYQSGKWALKVNILAKDADGVQHPIDGLFTDGFLSAGGFSSGGGGGGGSDIDLLDLAAIRAMTAPVAFTTPEAWAIHQLDLQIPSDLKSSTTASEDKVLMKQAGSNEWHAAPMPDSDASYIHDQSSAASVWEVNHNLGKYPSVTVVTSTGTVIEADVRYASENKLYIYFGDTDTPISRSGKAYLN